MNQSEIQKRLSEIAATNLQDLEDEAVLELLAERKKLLAEEARLAQKEAQQKSEAEKRRKEEARLQAEAQAKERVQKKQALEAELAALNKEITPDQDDEKLLALIQQRKLLEAELNVLTAGPEEGKSEEVQETAVVEEKKKSAKKQAPKRPVEPVPIPEPIPTPVREPEPEKQQSETQPVEEVVVPQESVAPSAPEPVTPAEPVQEEESKSENITIDADTAYTKTYVSPKGKLSKLEDSAERLVIDPSIQGGEYQGYLNELKANVNSLGTFLQALPIAARRNRAFMLEVASIDPAYAMHYADKDTLKKDETFNVAIAGMNNQRNTGNPLSEMLPEMRTGPVLLAGVKNDFKNVRFLRPEMPEYEEILALAQKGALEAVASLKSAHDIAFLLPPILQKDKAFMAKVNVLTTSR